MTTKRWLIVVAVVIGLVAYAIGVTFLKDRSATPTGETEPIPEAETPVVLDTPYSRVATIGSSVNGNPIEVHSFGTGSTTLLFVGGVHGGYEWNSTLLAYEAIDYFTADESRVPENLTINIIPTLNPDGLALVVGKVGRFALADVASRVRVAAGRFNQNEVDLNRNFDCKWQPESTWRENKVSAGTAPFSEPEAAALRDFVYASSPAAVVFWHSQANTVYASECEAGILPRTRELMNLYATAADYGAVAVFDAYPITGDAEGWLASISIPAITVELETTDTTEWDRNRAGIEAVIALYNQSPVPSEKPN